MFVGESDEVYAITEMVEAVQTYRETVRSAGTSVNGSDGVMDFTLLYSRHTGEALVPSLHDMSGQTDTVLATTLETRFDGDI